MKKIIGLVFVLVFLLISASISVADQSADEVAIAAVMARFDAGEISSEQALVLALEQDISYSVIVSACESRLIPLSMIIAAATKVGVSSEVALAKMAAAGVSQEKMSAAITAASGIAGEPTPGVGYTPALPTQIVAPVVPVTTNPGNTLTPNTVSPSTL